MEVALAEVFRCLPRARSMLGLWRDAATCFLRAFGAGEPRGWWWWQGGGGLEAWSCEATLVLGGVLCLGCWHVPDDLAYLGAVPAGGRLLLEVRGRTLSVLP